jgi:RNA polymerase sigma factor (sigma-70 family)
MIARSLALAASAAPEATPKATPGATPDEIPKESPVAILSSWPAIEGELRRRGAVLAPLPEEGSDGCRNRVGTTLMGIFRDTRSTESFEALYALAGPGVLQWIRSLLHRGLSYLDARELLQDTFVNVYRYPRGFREDHAGSFRVWVRTIAGNVVRRASSRRARLSFQELPEGLQEPEDHSHSPARRCLEAEQEQRLRAGWILFLRLYAQSWPKLSPRDRQTLHLVEVEGRSYAEAGRILGVSHSNMKMIVFRSRKRLAGHIRAALTGGPADSRRVGAA